MVLLALGFILVSCFYVAVGAGTPCRHVLKEAFSPPREWFKARLPPPDYPMTLRVVLTQPADVIHEHLYAISDPDSPRYGQHLSKEAVNNLLIPGSGVLNPVNNWLVSHGFDLDEVERSPAKDWLKVSTTVKKAEEMLNTTYHIWTNSKTGDSLVRTTAWSVPDFLEGHIDVVHPTTMFGTGLKPRATHYRLSSKPVILPQPNVDLVSKPGANPVDPSCNTTITPRCLLQLYNAVNYKIKAEEKGKIAIASYLEQFANIADLQQFYRMLVPKAVNSSFNLISINGGQNSQNISLAGSEADLDVEYAFGLTFPIPATVYTTAGSPPFNASITTPTNTNEPYLDWVDFLLAQDEYTLPQSISTSYADEEQTVPPSFANMVCNRFALLGTRGVTLVFGSGDGGVGDNNPNPANTTCISNDGKNRTMFLPEFPASCPFITSVGGTVNVPEVAVTRFGSGGGFSNYFSRPSYQSRAVEPFIKAQGSKNAGLYNPHGRGIPDVAAQGDNYVIILKNQTRSIGGTSAATPTFTAIVALLNDARLAAGKKPLGFINPLIYKFPDAFNDITVGSNPGCGTQGFQCRKGWDAVTGLGTPNFEKLKDIVLRLP